MKDIELECMPSWRYCQVRTGEKIPYPAGWQNQPRNLQQILSNNLGLLLGPKSGGVVALDFDGATAWTWYVQQFGTDIPITIAWTSGKESRCQMAFQVPEDYWPLLRTIKVTTGEHEGFEFRWDRTQSIMPPSQLNDGRCYSWISAPSSTNIADLPEAILDWWVMECNPVTDLNENQYPPVDEPEVIELAQQLKQLHPGPFEYDRWSRITWAFCNTIGYADGIALMRYHWPEQQAGEYNNLNSKPPERKCTIGTVKKIIKELGGQPVTRHQVQYKGFVSRQAELDAMLEQIQEKRAKC